MAQTTLSENIFYIFISISISNRDTECDFNCKELMNNSFATHFAKRVIHMT